MENFSIKSYAAQFRIFSGSADPPKTKSPDSSSETSTKPASKTEMQTSGLQNKDGDTVSLSLEARIIQISMMRSDDGAPISRSGYSRADLHQPMGNPEDVASLVLQQLQNEHSEKGGSVQAFVDDIQKRMDSRREAVSRNTDGFSDFRKQVDSLITSGLSAWSQSGGQALNIQA
jgi:hypothetical protein